MEARKLKAMDTEHEEVERNAEYGIRNDMTQGRNQYETGSGEGTAVPDTG